MSTSSPRQPRIPHVFALLTFIILICSVATYVVPAGKYQRETRKIEGRERTLVVPGTYESLPKHYTASDILLRSGETPEGHASPVSVLEFLTAIPRGLQDSADIIFFIFLLGGTFGILQRTGTIPATIRMLLDHLGHSATLLTIVIMLCLAVGGSTLGMGEEFIPLVPVFLLISHRLGYDRIYGLCLVMLAADIGFASATTNPFTVNIAQGIAELKLNSGLSLRIAYFVCAITWTIRYVLRYGARIKADPAASLLAGDTTEMHDDNLGEFPFSNTHAAAIVCCGLTFVGILYGVQELGWWLPEMAGGFLLMGLIAAAVCRLPINDAAKAFTKGMEEMVVAALVVGFARGIQVVLTDAQVLDTVIHAAATVLAHVPESVSAVGMFLFQSVLNFFIPSGSGQAAVTMPLMAPLADVLGITRQTAVLAYQFGDGLSNSIIPTSGMLMAMLALAKIPYTKWVRFFYPLLLQLSALAAVFLIIAVAIGYK